MTTCVYAGLGVHTSISQKFSFMSQFDRFIGFEPNPYQYAKIKDKASHMSGVEIYNVAVSDNDSNIEYYIADDEVASSVYPLNSKTKNATKDMYIKDTVNIQCVHLGNFLKSIDVRAIDMYISDIQGNDLTAIKSMENLLLSRSIGTIQAEVHGLNHSLYTGSCNKLHDFLSYAPLVDNYLLKSISFDGVTHRNNNTILKHILNDFEYDVTWSGK